MVPTDKSGYLAILNEASVKGNVADWNAWKRQKDDYVPRLDSDEPPPGDPGEIDLSGLALPGAKLPGIDFRGVVLRGANLSGGDLSRANLKFATLDGADLRDCKLIGANLWGCSFEGADLRGANLEGAKCVDSWTAPTMTDARYNRATVLPPTLDPRERRMVLED
jgi:uncharacterized protein YjbI with pentapeptide repeats